MNLGTAWDWQLLVRLYVLQSSTWFKQMQDLQNVCHDHVMAAWSSVPWGLLHATPIRGVVQGGRLRRCMEA